MIFNLTLSNEQYQNMFFISHVHMNLFHYTMFPSHDKYSVLTILLCSHEQAGCVHMKNEQFLFEASEQGKLTVNRVD